MQRTNYEWHCIIFDCRGKTNHVIIHPENSHGDVIGLTDNNGTLTETYTYDAFGTLTYIQSLDEEGILTEADTVLSRFLYAGEQYDEVTDLYYLRARRYDTTVGRFTQEDTYLGDGRNLYVYVQNNPLKYVDPSGHSKNVESKTLDSADKKNPFWDANLQGAVISSQMADSPAAQAGQVLGTIYAEALQEAEPIDYVQAGLDVVGLYPGLGEPMDIINGCISLERGNKFDATMSFISAVPVAGILTTVAKGAKKVATPVVKVIKRMLGSLSYMDEAIEAGADASRYMDELAEAIVEGGSASGRNLVDNMDEFAEDIININKRYSDGFELNNSIKNILNSASYYDDPYEQVAAVTRSITDHAFANGNKRTALDTLNMLIDELGLDDVLTDSQKWDLIYDIAEGRLNDVTEIGRILKGK